MKNGSRLAWGLGIALSLAAGLGWWQRGNLTLAAMSRQVNEITAVTDPLAALPDGLHVGLCGAGSPFPDEARGGPCTVVVAGRRMFVVDAGAGAARTLSRMRLNAGQIDTVFLTHYHSDHIDGLGELMLQRWIQRTATAPLPVCGPHADPGSPGTEVPQALEAVVGGFVQAYTPDSGWRTAHHTAAVAPPAGFGASPVPFDLPADGARRVLVNEPDLEVAAFRVDHGPVRPAVGYRFRYKGRTVVISGDTRKNANVEREAQGADLLLHEALSPELLGVLEQGFRAAGRNNLAGIMHDVLNYHTTPVEAAQTAQAAGVKALVFHHIVPPLPSAGLHPLFLQGTARVYTGPVRIGTDGDWISLPAGSAAVNFGQRP